MNEAQYVRAFRDLGLDDLAEVGGKNASLGELIRELNKADVLVPDGFAITADAFRIHLSNSGLDAKIYPLLDRLVVSDVSALAKAGAKIRGLISSAPLPQEIDDALVAAYRQLSKQYEEEATDVAVRSSATAEDLPTASFAGQQETYLNVRGVARLRQSVKDCMASLFTDRAIVYRHERGFSHRDVALSVGVQKMVRSDLGSAGVIFTLDTETGFRDVVLITGTWGLGETVVQGRVNPDEFWVHKPTLAGGFAPIVRRELGDKARKLIYARGGTKSVAEVRVSRADRQRFVLRDEEVLSLARSALSIERHYSKRANGDMPMDIEWGKDGRTGQLFILQARPETVHSQNQTQELALFRMTGKGKILTRGKSVGGRIGSGRVRVVHQLAELSDFEAGEVLVADMTDPDWEPVLKKAAAVVTDHGGRTCHAAIVSRELGIPCVVGTGNASAVLRTGDTVTVSCAEGDEGHVYQGEVKFEHQVVNPEELPKPRVPVMLNIGNPENAFRLAQLPSAGVGLVRLEFIISSWIGVHPLALLYPSRIKDVETRRAVEHRAAGFGSLEQFFVDRLSTGVAQIAAAFYPRPVIVRMSDFKTNEYASLLGGTDFEPIEHNPMIGFRGASRYYDPKYREGFALECQAMLRVRRQMGLTNVKLMIPFCRTLEEGRKVLQELSKNGLKRGEDKLEVYVMCEIPNNVILAEEFSELFDGFSIGSNDLTQLALGVDRDSELLSHIFNERDPGVKRLIEMVVEKAHKKNRKVGICGQAPSDYPDFAEFLMQAGVDTISVTSDALPKVAARLGPRRKGL